jgi:hypothetical protein
MLKASGVRDPVVLSYLALRKAVGYVALCLPFVLTITWWFVHDNQTLQTSISAYYYTGMRNLFVGSLCAISMFMLCCRGYDRHDEIAGLFSSVCALGVAFCPTTPACPKTKFQYEIGTVHYTFAALLFLTLTYFCLVLFKQTADPATMTREKRKRNLVYTLCGCTILTSILLIVILKIVLHREYLVRQIGTVLCFETTSLIAFGIAWLVKGETFLRDVNPQAPGEKTTDNILMLAHRRQTGP